MVLCLYACDAELFDLALRHHQNGNLTEAETFYRQLLQSNPGHADVHHMLGILNHQQNRHDAARRNPPGHRFGAGQRRLSLQHGQHTNEHGPYGQSSRMLRTDTTPRPQPSASSQQLGRDFSGTGEYGGSDRELSAGFAHQSRKPDALNNLATALLHQKQFREAIDCLQQALRIKPDYVMAHINLGNVLKDQGKFAEAVECFQKAARINPGMPEAHFNLGNALLEKGEYAAAAESFRNAAIQSQSCRNPLQFGENPRKTRIA